MHPTARAAVIAGFTAALLSPCAAEAQVRASELGSMTQVIDGTKLSVVYSRPRTRGRAKIFGTPVAHWGEVWTPGANWATVLELSKDVTINGMAVPKGKYSVWMVLREHGDWTTVLEPNWRIFHMNPPDSNAAQVRIATPVSEAPFVDVLTWSMPELSMSGGTLAMQWGTTRATLKVNVTPSMVFTMPEAEAQPYLGQYEYRQLKPMAGVPALSTLFVTYRNNTLLGRWEPNDPYMKTFALIRVGPDIFTTGVYDEHGTIYEVLRPDMMITFRREAGKPVAFTVRDIADEVEATGTRKP